MKKAKRIILSFGLEKVKRNFSTLSATLVLLSIPLFISQQYFLHLLVISMIYGVLAASWDLTMGYSGIFNFSHVAFLGVGAYTTGILTKNFGVNPWVSMLISAIITVLISLICALPTLRLKGIYVCLFTFVFQQLISAIVLFNPYGWTGGGKGLPHIPPLKLGVIDFGGISKIPIYYLTLSLFIFSLYILNKVVNSSVGLAFKALRDHAEYAISRGISPYRYKISAWIVGAFFAGLFGALYAHYSTIISREVFGFSFLSLILASLVIGGMGTIYGPVIGSFFMIFLSEYLRDLGTYRFMIVAVVTLLVLLFIRGGLARIVKMRFYTKT